MNALTFIKECLDCKYFVEGTYKQKRDGAYGECTHPYWSYCNCSNLWTPKEVTK